jgi:phosphoribosylanthranilate isomerase
MLNQPGAVLLPPARERRPAGELLIKVCGLRDAAALSAAVEAGADLVGFVFAPSRRQVTPAVAAALVRLLPADGPRAVGVFVESDPATVRAIADTVGLAFVQLCGREQAGCDWGRPVIRALRPHHRVPWRELARWAATGARLLIDSWQPGSAGGSGVVGDWRLARRIAARYPLLLAGGLTPDNVAAAIAAVAPAGVDVSSGVETAGEKEPAKIRAFIQRARAAYLSLQEQR